MSAMIYCEGDTAIYLGSSELKGGANLLPGDHVTVVEGNEDHDDDAVVDFAGVRFSVNAEQLSWVSGA